MISQNSFGILRWRILEISFQQSLKVATGPDNRDRLNKVRKIEKVLHQETPTKLFELNQLMKCLLIRSYFRCLEKYIYTHMYKHNLLNVYSHAYSIFSGYLLALESCKHTKSFQIIFALVVIKYWRIRQSYIIFLFPCCNILF